MTNALYALAVMGLLGAYDTLVYHELVARLPHRTTAQRELQLHAARDFVYMTLFATLAWLEPHGTLVLVLGVLLLTEIAITLSDFIVEDRSRALPAGERAMHAVMGITYGVFLTLLFPALVTWYQAPTGFAAGAHGWLSWLLSAFALGVGLSGIRDIVAAARLARRMSVPAEG
jgi:uncharacterized protein